MYGFWKGKQFNRLRKMLRDKKIPTRQYLYLATYEYNFVGITQRCGWRNVLKTIYRGYIAVRRLYLESYDLPTYNNPTSTLGGT